jgi:2,3-bisphosphoglycerate-independent phosphoglycerate mutase
MSDTTKGILIIGDGMADRPVPELNGQTPLEAANTPTLDALAREGECGLLDPIAPGVRPGSDTAHLALLGYDPYRFYTGRGPFEAAGIGLEVRGGDVCFRCNFSTVGDGMIVRDRRAGRIERGTDQLAAALNGLEIDGVTCYFKESVEHRAALVLRGPGLGHDVSDVDPHAEGGKIHPAQGKDPASEKTARVVNEFVRLSYERLKDHPVNRQREQEGKPAANIVLPRGAGIAPHLTPFQEKYGLRGSAIVEVGLIRGIARYLQMDHPEVPGATGGYDTDEIALARATVDALADHDYVLCNLKAPDLGGHDGDPRRKMAAIEKLDRLVRHVVDNAPSPLHLGVCADHTTAVEFRDHCGDAVPALFWGPRVRPDSVTRYGERFVLGGGVGRVCGRDVMNLLTNWMGTQEKFGA